MIRNGSLPSRTGYVDQDVLVEMAATSGRHVEIHDNTAYLTTGGRIWIAKLAPAGEVTS